MNLTIIISDTALEAKYCAEKLGIKVGKYAWANVRLQLRTHFYQGTLPCDTECIFYGPCTNIDPLLEEFVTKEFYCTRLKEEDLQDQCVSKAQVRSAASAPVTQSPPVKFSSAVPAFPTYVGGQPTATQINIAHMQQLLIQQYRNQVLNDIMDNISRSILSRIGVRDEEQ